MKCKHATKVGKQIKCSKINDLCMFLDPDEKKCRQLNGQGPIKQTKPVDTKEKKIVKSTYLALALSWLKIKFTRDYQGNYVFERTEKFNYAWVKLNHLRKELEEWEEK